MLVSLLLRLYPLTGNASLDDNTEDQSDEKAPSYRASKSGAGYSPRTISTLSVSFFSGAGGLDIGFSYAVFIGIKKDAPVMYINAIETEVSQLIGQNRFQAKSACSNKSIHRNSEKRKAPRGPRRRCANCISVNGN